jgi:hypothetical protein
MQLWPVSLGVLAALGMSGAACLSKADDDPAWTCYATDSLEPGRVPELMLPVTFTIAPGSYLFVNGQQVDASVTLSLGSGGELYANGIQIEGPHQRSERRHSEEALAKYFGEVPLVREEVRQGSSWADAYEKWAKERDRVITLAWDHFKALRAEGRTQEEAARAAEDIGMEADTAGIFKHPGGIEIGDGAALTARLIGREDEFHIMINVARAAERTPEEEANRSRGRAKYLFELLRDDKTPAFIQITFPGGGRSLVGEIVASAVDQLDRARKSPGQYPSGPLDQRELRGILTAEGVAVDW